MPSGRSVLIWRSCLLPGSETFVRNHGDALTRWRPTYVGAVKVDSPIAADTDVIVFPEGSRGRRAFLRLRATGGSTRLRGAFRELDPAVVHAHFGGDGWLVSRAVARLGIPLVITLHGRDVTTQANQPGMRGSRYRRNLRTAFERATLVLAVSEFIRRKAIGLGADPAKTRVHYTGVPMPPAPPPRPGPKPWDLVFVGRLVEKKGIDDLLAAIAMLPEPRPQTLVIGGGPLAEPMRTRAAELGVDVTFRGQQDPEVVRRCLAEAKVFVAPSKTASDGDAEGLPTTILEAASLCLPTVSTVHSGIPEAVVPGETGLVGAEGDRSALADNIRRLLADDALRARLGRRARTHVETHFELRKQTQLLEELYDAVAGGGGWPTPAPRANLAGRSGHSRPRGR